MWSKRLFKIILPRNLWNQGIPKCLSFTSLYLLRMRTIFKNLHNSLKQFETFRILQPKLLIFTLIDEKRQTPNFLFSKSNIEHFNGIYGFLNIVYKPHLYIVKYFTPSAINFSPLYSKLYKGAKQIFHQVNTKVSARFQFSTMNFYPAFCFATFINKTNYSLVVIRSAYNTIPLVISYTLDVIHFSRRQR